MPLTATPGPKFKGLFLDQVNGRLALVYNGTKLIDFDANDIAGNVAIAQTGGITASTGNIVATAGDLRVTAGNARLGAVSAFATTEPTSALVMKAGTAPAGAIATSGGLFSSATVVQKIIADGTVSNVET